MSEKSVRPAIPPQLSRRQAAADCINQALEKSDNQPRSMASFIGAVRLGSKAKNAKLTQEQRNAMMAEVRKDNRFLAAFRGGI